MSISLDLGDGATAQIDAVDGDRIVVTATVASPPGSTLVGRGPGDVAEIRIKVRGCRSADAGFRIEGRLVNLSRRQRAVLAEV